MRKIIAAISFVLILTVSLSCNSPRENTSQEKISSCDETLMDTIPILEKVSSFPDTMYPSAQILMFRIDTFCYDIPAELSDLNDYYSDAPGIFTFRGSLSRNPSFSGRLHGDSLHISVDWTFATNTDTTHTIHGVWGGGTGWTGQPLYIHWPDSIMERFSSSDDTLTQNITPQEIIVASLCGYVYFIDFHSGKPTRPFLDTQNVLKGTPSINPSLNGSLYIGHGVPKQGVFGHSVYDLYSHQLTQSFGRDRSAWRRWNAFDSSPLVTGGFLFRPGENGTLYKYHIQGNSIQLHSTLRYSTTKYKGSPGIESSMAICRNYGYFNDNAGNILCVNLNTLKPVWRYHNHDDSDASPIVEMDDGIPYVYSGCEVDRQGSTGLSYFVKLNGLTGERIWEDTIRGGRIHLHDKILDGGMLSSPLLGKGDCSQMIFNNFCINDITSKGCLAAIDKRDGTILYTTPTRQYSWSSPVAFYNDNDEMFIFTGDAAGYVYLIKGKTGEIVASKKIGINFESSPIIVEDKIILGSRGNKIFKISLY